MATIASHIKVNALFLGQKDIRKEAFIIIFS
jgi:hypothetical protein